MASDRRNPRSQVSPLPPAATPTPQIPPDPPSQPLAVPADAATRGNLIAREPRPIPPPLLPSADDLGGSSSSSSSTVSSVWRRTVCREVGGESIRLGVCSGENAIIELASKWGISAEDAISSSGNVEPTEEIVEYLLILYFYNAPVEDLSTFPRILFLIEEAYKTYQDDFWDRLKCLKPFKELKDFAKFIFEKCNFLTCYISDFEDIFDNFDEYKSHVTSRGAVILDHSFEKVLQ